jgi:peptide/nickel transport system permease protein
VSAALASGGERLALRLERLERAAKAERRFTTATLAVGAVIVLAIPLAALCAPLLGVPDPNHQDLGAVLQSPSWAHPFGTDSVGRDLFSRTLAATWVDYPVGIVTTYVPLAMGVALGVIAGYFGGFLDALIMRIADVFLAFPFMVFVIAFIAVFGAGLLGVYVGIIAFGWASFARITRGEMLVLRERQFIRAGQTLGLPTRRILFVHALPQLLRPNLVFSMAVVVLNILALASLSYLGLGVQPPTPEWGAIVADGQQYLFTAWWVSTLPGLVVVLAGVGFSLLGDGLADRFGYDFRLTV